MRQEVARAQADTLRLWAENHENMGGEGFGDVAFLLRRAAKAIEDAAAGRPVEAQFDKMEREPQRSEELRED